MIKKNIIKKRACNSKGVVGGIERDSFAMRSGLVKKNEPVQKIKKRIKATDYQDWLLKQLLDQEFALGYINATMDDEDSNVFLIALKDVLLAQEGGMASVAKKTKLNRQNLYRMLSDKGNPRWNNLKAIFDMLGYKLQLVKKDDKKTK